jgi:hypothetical protein
MKFVIPGTLLLTLFFLCFGCGGNQPAVSSSDDSPTNAYQRLYAAVKSKDTEAIKKQLTKKSVDFGVMAAERNKTAIEKVYENGFTATTFSETLPRMRDERINADMGALEVWNSKDSRWEDLPFIKEDGAWKLAVGDMFANTYKSPGPGLDLREKQAANAASNTVVGSVPSNNANAPIPITNAGPGAPPNPKAK